MKKKYSISGLGNDSGAIAVITAIMLTMLLSFVALSIDVGHLAVTKNELQNAADAGALAGANALFNSSGTKIETGCNQIAYDTTLENYSAKSAVEVNWKTGDNTGSDVERGHWSFTTRTFTPNDIHDSEAMTNLWGASAAALDIDTDYINAVRVKARRESTPIPSFFARIFGHDSFKQTAEAIAYRGLAGTFAPGEIDFPMVLCEEEIYPNDPDHSETPVCTSAVLYEKAETAMWTNLIQVDLTDDVTENDTCGTNADQMKKLMETVLSTGNKYPITVGEGIGVQNGIQAETLRILIDEWEKETTDDPDGTIRRVKRYTFPVAPCNDNVCVPVTGAVEIDVLWMIEKKVTDKSEYAKAPYAYYDADVPDGHGGTIFGELLFSSTVTDDELRWDAFQKALGLPTVDDDKLDKTIFFKPTCEPAIPKGGPGGINSGVHAARAVLVN